MLEVAALVLLIDAIAELPAVSGDDAVRRVIDAALRLDGFRRLARRLELMLSRPVVSKCITLGFESLDEELSNSTVIGP